MSDKKHIKQVISCFLMILNSSIEIPAQDFDSLVNLLELDTQYCFFQFHNNSAARKLQQAFNKENGRTVILHYGASHIQSEVVTTKAAQLLKRQWGDAGVGFVFPFSAADTYDGVNYKSSHKGKWSFAKSYQLPPKIPLGIRGMTVETEDTSAAIFLQWKEALPVDTYEILIFMETNDSTPSVRVCIDTLCKVFERSSLYPSSDGILRMEYFGPISRVELQWWNDSNQIIQNHLLRLYGISIEKKKQEGVIYHPMGVGASPFQAVLHLEKLNEHAEILRPDIVIIDYGTNNILYTNKVSNELPKLVKEAVTKFRSINPNVTLILTSTQDLYYKRRYIDAAIDFNIMMDSLAAEHGCLYWNFYDLSGGYKRIRDWNAKGFAKDDFVHLTPKGYDLKGLLLYKSFANTLNYIDRQPESTRWCMPVCMYDDLVKSGNHSDSSINKAGDSNYFVKRGDTLSSIAAKYGVSVKILMKLNNLSSDRIKIGQSIRLR